MSRRSTLVLALLTLVLAGCAKPAPQSSSVRVQAAIVQLRPLEGRSARGIIDLIPTGGGLSIEGELLGLLGRTYELRVHQLGDCTDPRGRSAGAAFTYTDPVTGRDVNGSMLAVESNATGEVPVSGRFRGGRLSGPLSLRGRSVVVHRIDRAEDGSPVDTRVACGVVGIAREGN